MPADRSTPTLIIRAARTEVLLSCIEQLGAEASTLLTSSRDGVPAAMEIIEAPAGPLRWRRFSDATRARLGSTRWRRIVLLHNGVGDYLPVYLWLTKLTSNREIVIFYPDRRQQRFPSAFRLILHEIFARLMASGSFLRDLFIVIPTLLFFPLLLILSRRKPRSSTG